MCVIYVPFSCNDLVHQIGSLISNSDEGSTLSYLMELTLSEAKLSNENVMNITEAVQTGGLPRLNILDEIRRTT